MSANDILFRYNPTGASETTASQDDLSAGVKASHQMAKTDLPKLTKYREDFIKVGEKHGLPPALLAAIASRETRGGSGLSNGYGDHGNGYGLMQVDKRYHKLSGGPFSREHIDQAAGILKASFLAVQEKHPDWPYEQQLRGGVTAYNSGVRNVQSIKGMDEGTTGDDYSNDTWARAQYLAPHFGGGANGNVVVPSPVAVESKAKSLDSKLQGTKATGQQAQGSPIARDLQQLLVKYGYMTEQQVRTGPGILGPQTRAALSRFMKDKGTEAVKASTPAPIVKVAPATGKDAKKGTSKTPVVGFDPKQKLLAVHPVLAERANRMAAALALRNIPIRLTDGLRTFAEQDVLYAKGRTTHLDQGIVTNAKGGFSNHNYGLAVDVVPLVNGQPNWGVSEDVWKAIGEEGRKVGLEWGGDWKKLIDRPHFQLPVGMDIAKCMSLYKKGGLPAVWAEADARLLKAA
jgi:hypothetical protein